MGKETLKPSILHLFSNHRWTGPAEPVLTLVKNLREIGWNVHFACSVKGIPKDKYNKVLDTAIKLNIPTYTQFYLSKHRHLIKDFIDYLNLKSLLKENNFSIIHCHLDNDHRLAVKVAEKYLIPVVRSNYNGEGLSTSLRKYISQTSLIFEPSLLSQKNDISNFSVSEEKCPLIPLAIDLDRFNPSRKLADIRSQLKIPPDAIIIGIVARIQPHRKYDLLLQTINILIQEGWKIYLIIIGRGTKQEELVIKPVNELGLKDNVIFTGYLDKDDYVSMLNAIDIGVYLVPGTDGTCRTVREYMAMGKPVIATKTGILPELIDNMHTGILVEDTVESLYMAIRELCAHPQLRNELGKNARAKALSQFSPINQAQIISQFYELLLRK